LLRNFKQPWLVICSVPAQREIFSCFFAHRKKEAVAEEAAQADPEIKTKAAMEAAVTKVEPRKDRTKRQPQAVAKKEARNSNGGNIKAH